MVAPRTYRVMVMNKPLLALLLVLTAGLSGLGLLLPPSSILLAGTPASTEDHSQLNPSLPHDWEQRLRTYQKARARLQLNESLSAEARRAALERLHNEHFNADERRWLKRHPASEGAPQAPPAAPH